MSTWPTTQINEDNLDEDDDSTTSARAELLEAIQRINELAVLLVPLLDNENTFTQKLIIEALTTQLVLRAASTAGCFMNFNADSSDPTTSQARMGMANALSFVIEALDSNVVDISMFTNGGAVTLNGDTLLTTDTLTTTPNKDEWPTLANDDGSTPDQQVIKVTAGRILDSTGTVVMELTSDVYKYYDVDFDTGGVINFPVGCLAPNLDAIAGWNPDSPDLHFLVIAKADGTCDVMMTYQDTIATDQLPTDYIYWRRIHTIRGVDNGGTAGNIEDVDLPDFVQVGDDIIYDTPQFIDSPNTLQVGDQEGTGGLDKFKVLGIDFVPRLHPGYIAILNYYIENNVFGDFVGAAGWISNDGIQQDAASEQNTRLALNVVDGGDNNNAGAGRVEIPMIPTSTSGAGGISNRLYLSVDFDGDDELSFDGLDFFIHVVGYRDQRVWSPEAA